MSRRSKIIFIALFSVCIFLLVMGIYFFPDEEPNFANRDKMNPKQIPEQQSRQKSPDAVLKKEPIPTVASAGNTVPQPRSDAGAPKANPYVSYPEGIVELLGIDMSELEKERDAFKNTIIHVGWMDRVNEILKNLDPEKKEAIIKNHTALLYIKDKLNEAYLTGKIDHETFKKAIADLMKWHQRTYESILSPAEYETLFEISPDKVDDTIDALIDQTPEYSFILNQNLPVDAVKEKVQGYKLEEVNSHFKKMILDRDNIGKQINSGAMTLEQARAALNKSQQAFIAKCKEILTEDEINTIFGSVTALETGSSQSEAPAVLGDSDEMELGFEIENPNTSIETVKEKLDTNKIEDIKFFYQDRAAERDQLLEKLDKGEITEEALENISKGMDAAFEENCRSTLTDEEYQLIFGNIGAQDLEKSPDEQTLETVTEPDAATTNEAEANEEP